MEWFNIHVVKYLRMTFILLKITSNLKCDKMKNPSRAVSLEWSKFPENQYPDFYIITYHIPDDFAQKVSQTLPSYTFLVVLFFSLIENVLNCIECL